jgi:hypothetical protein
VSRFTPVAQLTIDGRRLSAAEAALLRAEVALALGPAHDRCTLELHALAPTVPAPGGQIALALGFDDAPQDVFTGLVVRVERHAGGAVVECLAPSSQLSRRRVAQSWVGQGAKQIASEMLGDAGVTAGVIGADLDLGIFHADDRRSRWDHLLRLARLAGCEVASAADGSLDLRPPKTGPAKATLRRGAELIAWQASTYSDEPAGSPVAPAGAGSEAGADHWHLPLASPAGEAPDREAWVPGALRDRDAARSVAQALADAASRRKLGGEALCWGQPTLRPGDLVTLAEIDGGDVETRLTAVTQVLDGNGYATWLDFEGAS